MQPSSNSVTATPVGMLNGLAASLRPYQKQPSRNDCNKVVTPAAVHPQWVLNAMQSSAFAGPIPLAKIPTAASMHVFVNGSCVCG